MNKFKEELTKNKFWLYIAGILLIFSATILTMYIVINVEYAFYSSYLLAGMVMIIQGVKFWYRKWLGFILHLGAGILNVIFVVHYFISNNSFITLLYLYLASFVIIGAFRILTGISQFRYYVSWVVTLICGLINICSASALILFPTFNNLLMVCLLDFFFTGLALLALGININYRLKLSK